jgi:hypothetical protein
MHKILSTISALFLLFFYLHLVNAEEFIYPIDQVDNNTLLIMRQKSLHEIELLSWEIDSKKAQKVLWSIYMPSSVSLLPSKAGFSFMDQGRLRIKYFNKRSPKTINIYDPITAIDSIGWINDEIFYFTAEDPYFHNVFVCELHKNIAALSRLTFEEDCDFLYPQKINDSLFVIKRDPDKNFSIVKLPWIERSFENYKSIQGTTIFTNEKSYCFLKMQNPQLGYFISYTPCKNNNNIYTFYCNEICFSDNEWKHKEIFKFDVHGKYITGKSESRMYESIKPLLPYYSECGIFFSHFDNNKKTSILKKYDTRFQNIEPILIDAPLYRNYTSLFTPLIFDGIAYCGMIREKKRELVMFDETENNFQLDICEIKVT